MSFFFFFFLSILATHSFKANLMLFIFHCIYCEFFNHIIKLIEFIEPSQINSLDI
jgi:hypothetical protein